MNISHWQKFIKEYCSDYPALQDEYKDLNVNELSDIITASARQVGKEGIGSIFMRWAKIKGYIN